MALSLIQKRLDIMRCIAIVTYKEWAAYRTHSMVSILVGPLFFAVQILIWRAVYGGQEIINGLTLPMMLRYYAISVLVQYLTMDFADWNLQMLIHTGKYVTFTLRPIHHRFFALSQKVGHRILGFIFEFVPVSLIMVYVFQVDLKPAQPLWLCLSVLFSFLITFYMNYTVGLLGFWLTKTAGIRTAVKFLISISSGALIPLSFFPEWGQKLCFFLPFQHTVYVPAMVFMGTYQLTGKSLSIPFIVGVQGLYVIGIGCLSEIIYRAGNRHFNAVGG